LEPCQATQSQQETPTKGRITAHSDPGRSSFYWA
jgi:hypothetical protein